MRELVLLPVHLISTLARLLGPGCVRSVVAESLLVKHQLLILNRPRERAPNLRVSNRVIAGVCALLLRPGRVLRSAIVLKPSTILEFHRKLRKRKYRLLFSPRQRHRSGSRGPSTELVDAIVAMKRRNPSWGYRRIAQQIGWAFHIEIEKDVVRRVLAVHYRPEPGSNGPSWLTFLGHAKDTSGASICFAANQRSCEPAGCWLSWISRREGSSGLEFMRETWTEEPCAGCSIRRFEDRLPRNISVQTTILYISFINGNPIFGCWGSPKSRPWHRFRFHMLSWND